MTNLIEKSLLLGFGIFILIIFSSIILPFLDKIAEYNQNGRNDLETYMSFIDEIDQGINYVLENQNEIYLKKINYPANLNITFHANIAKYEFLIENQLCVKLKEYNEDFINRNFHLIPPGLYFVNFSFYSSVITINIHKL
jgi:hypothetical protein